MLAVSCISTMNVDWPRAMLSEAPTRAKSAIDDRELGRPRGHERAGLRHQAEQRRLSQVRRLAAHVRAGQDDELVRVAVERDVVRHERVGGKPLDHGWRTSVATSSSPSCISGLV